MAAYDMAHQDLLRELPAVDQLLGHARSVQLLARFNRTFLTRQCRAILDELRAAIRAGTLRDANDLADDAILSRLERRLESETVPALSRVVNATGTILHTNLGRALLASEAVEAVRLAADHAVNLEYDVARGERGQRELVLERLLVDLTGAEAATVVNNNAAAVMLALNTIADGRPVIVSRGELIEIGGAFRLPEIMAKSGAVLREIGTTNRTHPTDYEAAIAEQTALLLKVHTSNYRIVGFQADVSLPELVAIGRRHHVPVMEDLGSGALVDLAAYGLPREPVVAERIALGADIVTFSGDKILGGPQAGVILGRRTLIAQMARNPLHRALRCSKLTLAALEATLRLYRQSPDVTASIPALRMFTRPLGDIEATGREAVRLLQPALGVRVRLSLEDSTAQVGSGALPTEEIPTKVIAVEEDGTSAARIAERFRRARPPIIGRISHGRFLLDLRTIFNPADLVPRWTHD
jgi:L-seryl-tRNA(Ser) seleniumtransferase